ncbi:hypothetical protein Tco_1511323 [Tanacetum coccineum]
MKGVRLHVADSHTGNHHEDGFTPVRIDKSDDLIEINIIMVNVIPPDHVDDVPIVEPNQHDDVPVVPEPVLENEDEDPEEEEFEEEEEP